MLQSQFESMFAMICKKLNDARGSYNFTTNEEVWGNIGTNPLDIAFTELSELYLEADDNQKDYIFHSMAGDPALYDIWYFVRRIGKRINKKADTKWLEVGIAAALIEGERGDYRDLTVSLGYLQSDAKKHGIDTRPYFTGLQGEIRIPTSPRSILQSKESPRWLRITTVLMIVGTGLFVIIGLLILDWLEHR
jgi:hypothetical protein